MRLVARVVIAALVGLAGCSRHDTAPAPAPAPSADQIAPTTWTVRAHPIAPPASEPTEPAPRRASADLTSQRDGLGNYYDDRHVLVGHVDSSHNFYDATGTYVGRRNDDGSFFDGRGNYVGRIDVTGNVYANGGGGSAHLVSGLCDDDCKNDAVANVVLAR